MTNSTDLHERKIQTIEMGAGPKFHRTYTILLENEWSVVRDTMVKLKQDVNKFSPQALARFEKVTGSPTRLDVGDEFQIHISGPWNGPVRVAQVEDRSFLLKTLEGHMEAGEILFRIEEAPNKQTKFIIESWARSRDRLVDFVYDKIGFAKAAQTEMWRNFCSNFYLEAKTAAGHPPQTDEDFELLPDVEIRTQKWDETAGKWMDVE